MRVYLIRHGESAMNTQAHLIGGFSPHTPLTERGEAQARALGAYLATSGIVPDLVFASPAVRTTETARLAGFEPALDLRLAELGQGVWEGRSRKEAYDAAALARIKREEKAFKLEGGESMNDVAARMHAWLLDVLAAKPATVFAFGHGMAIRCLLGELFGWSHAKTYETVTNNTSISTFDRAGDAWTFGAVGATPHLA